jgi:hypothetical protein
LDGWKVDAVAAQPVERIQQAIALTERANVPARDEDPRLETDKARELIEALRNLGIKAAPMASADQAMSWVTVTAMALGDMPFTVSIRAAREALFEPIRFLSDVEAAVRRKAEGELAVRNLACMRLQRALRMAERGVKNIYD